MTIQIGQAACPTFQQPLALMSDCHRRVERFLFVLERVVQEAGGKPLNPLQREGLVQALRYFREAAPRHTADEEESLFPRLERLAAPEAVAALEKVRRLEADHQRAKADHALIESLGLCWLERGYLGGNDTKAFLQSVENLATLYQRHIAIEDNEIFPFAGRSLSLSDLEAVGREMAARRGQPYEPAGKPGL